MKRTSVLLACALVTACGGGSQPQMPVPVTSAPPPPPAVLPPPPVAAGLDTSLVVFIGDSITWIWDQSDRLQQQDLLRSHLPNFVDAGISGNETGQMLIRFDIDVLAKHPDVVVILGGVNDIKNSTDVDPSTVASNILAMAQKAESTGAKVIVGTVLAIGSAYAPQSFLDQADPRIDTLNKLLVAGATEYGYTIVDYHTPMLAADGTADGTLLADGLHPNSAGYAVMWKVLAPKLPAVLGAH